MFVIPLVTCRESAEPVLKEFESKTIVVRFRVTSPSDKIEPEFKVNLFWVISLFAV